MENGWVKRNKWIFVAGPLAGVLFVWIGGEVVMHLWNWLLPSLFGWRPVTFWQALGLLVLCRILFGGFGGHGPDRSPSRRNSNKCWERMTPEEREKLSQDVRAGADSTSGSAAESGEPA
jgi:hypothetical protein